jgi:hypothetical protein
VRVPWFSHIRGVSALPVSSRNGDSMKDCFMRVLPLNTSTKIVTASYQYFNMNKLWSLAILRNEPNVLLYCTAHYVSLFLENKAKKDKKCPRSKKLGYKTKS